MPEVTVKFNVDEKTLRNMDTQERKDRPIEDLVEMECGWLENSGISFQDILEIRR